MMFGMLYLTVREDRGIVALKAAFNELLSAVAVDGILLGIHVKHIVVGEGLVLSQNHLGLSRGHKCTNVTSFNLLFCQLRTDPAETVRDSVRYRETETERQTQRGLYMKNQR